MSRLGFAGGRAALLVAAALLLSLPVAHAQTGAILQGRTIDEQGKALPGATLTASNPATGLTRSQTSGGDGSYRFPSLAIGTWDIKAELSGFQGSEQKGIVLNVATTRTLDIMLSVAGMAQSITVTGEAPVVQSEPVIGAVVSQREMETLPLNGRQFANLAALAPGTQLAYNSDPTKPDQLTVALNGGIGRNINSTVDGGDNTDDTIGGALQNYSIEGVQEFNIQTQQYKAEFGRSTGGVLSVVTKTGTNDFHGSAFGFGRNDSLNSRTESEKAADADKQDYKRYQYGGSFGGPIVKEKVHFFTTYERTQRDTNYVVNTGVFPGIDGTVVPLPFRDNLFTAKVTANVSPAHFVQLRYGYQKNTGKYGQTPLYTPDALGTLENRYSAFLIGDQWTLPGGSVNEFLFQYSKFENSITADSDNPALYFPSSGVASGQNFNTPQTTNQTKYQFKDDFSFGKTIGGKRHDFKTGFNIIHEPTLGGDFSTGVGAPQFSFAGDSPDSPITKIVQFGGRFVNSTPVDQYGVYLQDDWRASSRLTLNMGLRYDIWTGFDLDQRTNPVWQFLSTQTTYNEDYLRDFQGGKGGVLENDKDNIAPRLGFSYDLHGDAKTFLRGGFGLYYDFPYTNATILFPSGAVQSDYAIAYQNEDLLGIRNPDGSVFRLGDPLPPNQAPPAGAPKEIASPTLRTPYSRQYSIGVSREVTEWLGVNLEGSVIQYRDIPFRFKINPVDPATGEARFPQFPSGGGLEGLRLWYGQGEASYKGINLSMRARLADKLTAQGFYTLSKADGNVLGGADEFRISDRGYQPGFPRDQAADFRDPLCDACFGPLNTDVRHKLTLSATYILPHGLNLSGMARFRSATPFTRFSTSDLNGDGFKSDPIEGTSHVNNTRGHRFSQIDLRLSKEFPLVNSYGFEIILEAFNIFNTKNPAGFRTDGAPTAFSGDPLQGEQRLAQIGARFKF